MTSARMLVLALLKDIEILGEAASTVFYDDMTEIPGKSRLDIVACVNDICW